MNSIEKTYSDLGYMDTLSSGDSMLHRLDPRTKVLTTSAFIIAVVSFGKYSILSFLPFMIYPLVLISAGGLPAAYFLKKVLLISPFALAVGIFNPLFDRTILFHVGMIGVSGGWVSFLSILTRFFLTTIAALLLIALTGFNEVCQALLRLGVPRPFVLQLMFSYRYIFVLSDEAQRMERARSLRSFHTGVMRYRTFTSLVSHLLLRTLDRAERIYCAMCCRGFDGNVRPVNTVQSGWRDISFFLGWFFFFLICRRYNIPAIIGDRAVGAFR